MKSATTQAMSAAVAWAVWATTDVITAMIQNAQQATGVALVPVAMMTAAMIARIDTAVVSVTATTTETADLRITSLETGAMRRGPSLQKGQDHPTEIAGALVVLVKIAESRAIGIGGFTNLFYDDFKWIVFVQVYEEISFS